MLKTNKLLGREYRIGTIHEGEEYTWPSIPVQIMMLLEDVGLFKTMTTKHPTFEDGMINLSFILPDAIIYIIALSSLIYAITLVF